jgi:hypothetical protein
MPTSALVAATARDPIYDVIEKHRDACKARSAAVDTEYRYEEETCLVRHMTAEQRRIYDEFHEVTGDSWDHLDAVSRDLLTTNPTTLGGVIALCDYLAPLLNDPALTDLPESVDWGDGTETAIAAEFAERVAKSRRDIAEREAGHERHG